MRHGRLPVRDHRPAGQPRRDAPLPHGGPGAGGGFIAIIDSFASGDQSDTVLYTRPRSATASCTRARSCPRCCGLPSLPARCDSLQATPCIASKVAVHSMLSAQLRAAQLPCPAPANGLVPSHRLTPLHGPAERAPVLPGRKGVHQRAGRRQCSPVSHASAADGVLAPVQLSLLLCVC